MDLFSFILYYPLFLLNPSTYILVIDRGEMRRKWVPNGNLYVFAPHPPNHFPSSEVVQESELEGYENIVASVHFSFPLESILGVINQDAEETSFAGVRWLVEIVK